MPPGSAPSREGVTPGAPFAHAGNGQALSRLRRIDDLVMEMSVQDDAERLVRVFARQGAFLVPRDGAPVAPAELDRLCLDHIARFKRPRDYRFVSALPKNNYGKVLKTELRRLLTDNVE